MMKELTAVGWQGIVLRAPKDWSLVAVTGDYKKGYFRADSTAATSAEVRWLHTKNPPDLERRARDFLREIERSCKKRKISFSSQVKLRKQTKTEQITGGTSVGFTWRGDRNGYGRLLYCPTCERVVISQVVSPLNEDASGLAGDLLGSLCDHQDSAWQTWALYDLQVALPSEFKLVKHTLMSSYVMLSFKSKDGELIVERWGLANMLLKRSSIDEWFKEDSLLDYTGFKPEITSVTNPNGHEGLFVRGRRRGIKQILRTTVRALTLRPLPQELVANIWHCPESNRLFAIRVIKDGAEELAEEIVRRVDCH